MAIQFIVGNLYTEEEIKESGYLKTKQSNLYHFYRKGDSLMIFELVNPKLPDQYKLKSVLID